MSTSESFEIQKIKPGILVTEEIHRMGGVYYNRVVLENYLEDKKRVREWQTKSVILNEEEFKQRASIISGSYAKVHRHCISTSVGLICPKSKETLLRESIAEARKEIDAFNSTATTCHIKARWGFFEVAEENQAAIAAVADQIAELADKVDKALTETDLEALKNAPRRFLNDMTPESIIDLPEKERNAILARVRAELIRSAIVEAKHLDVIVTEDVSEDVKGVVKQARQIARNLCNRVAKKNQAIEEVINEVDLSGIRKIRAAYVLAAAKADQKAALENTPETEASSPVGNQARMVTMV